MKMKSIQNKQDQDRDRGIDRISQANTWGLVQGTVFSGLLLKWFDSEARDLPWRQVRDPYRVMLSELMLQQTQVATVIPYYQRFLERWPTIDDLANADEQDVLKAWEGLGYYSRARNLLAAARQIVTEYASVIPRDEKQLLRLKGIGEYTAGAIRSIAYGLPAAAVDGNVVRVTARLAAIGWDPGELTQRREVRELIEKIQPVDRPGDFNEALMDLGATVCLPKSPHCADCPVQSVCEACKLAATQDYPRKRVRQASPVDHLTCLVFQKGQQIHVNQRPEKGLLAGLFEFDWGDPLQFGIELEPDIIREFRVAETANEQLIVHELGQRRHVFTHRIWQMTARQIILPFAHHTPLLDNTGRWVNGQELKALPFPTALAPWRDQITRRMFKWPLR